MDLSYGAEYEQFRGEVRQFLQAHWSDEDASSGPPAGSRAVWLSTLTGSGGRTDERATAFRIKAIERGYLYRHVPRRYGGGEQPPDALKSTIITEEFRRRAAPAELRSQGPTYLVLTLLEHGTEEQKQKFIRDTLLGKLVWCQGYSEPNAGSDLASLRTRADLDGDSWVVNGQKIWTSNANESDWIFCLVRTEPDKPKHHGITYLLIDMKTPGIDVRPMKQMTGDIEFNEVFLDNVRVPDCNRVGQRGQGWAVTRSTLKHERSAISQTMLPRPTLDQLIACAQTLQLRGRPAIEDPVLRARIVELETKVLAAEYQGYRLLTMQARNEEPGLADMVMKLYATVLAYEVGKCAMDMLADRGLLAPDEDTPTWMLPLAYMWSLGLLTAGGTANIQRNVIAERGLGLPRDAAPRR